MSAGLQAGRSHVGSTPAAARGSSLVELTAGLVAVVLAAGSAVSMAIHHARLRKSDAEYELARAACRNQLTAVRSLPLGSLPALDGTGFPVPDVDGKAGGLAPVPGDDDGLPGRITVRVDPGGAGETVYLVCATVTWTGAMAQQTLTLETVLGDRRGWAAPISPAPR